MAKRKRTNNDLQNTTQKTKDRATRTPLKTRGELRCSRMVSKTNRLGCKRKINYYHTIWMLKITYIIAVIYFLADASSWFILAKKGSVQCYFQHKFSICTYWQIFPATVSICLTARSTIGPLTWTLARCCKVSMTMAGG